MWQASPDHAAERLRFDRPLRDRVQAHLQRAETEATRILQANRSALEAMAKTLAAKGVLTGKPLQDFLDQLSGEPSLTAATDKPTEISSADEENIKLS